jgi:hypothetical protein
MSEKAFDKTADVEALVQAVIDKVCLFRFLGRSMSQTQSLRFAAPLSAQDGSCSQAYSTLVDLYERSSDSKHKDLAQKVLLMPSWSPWPLCFPLKLVLLCYCCCAVAQHCDKLAEIDAVRRKYWAWRKQGIATGKYEFAPPASVSAGLGDKSDSKGDSKVESKSEGKAS